MRNALLVLMLLAATMAAGAGAPATAPAPAAAPTGTLMLTVALDARGVRVLRATRKPDLAFRLPEDSAAFPLHWTLRDGAGAVLATGAADPGPVCLDPAHLHQPGHAQGDVAVPHELCTNVKVPDLGARLQRVEFAWHGGGLPRAFGSADRAALGLGR
jgi:hypothetical protein